MTLPGAVVLSICVISSSLSSVLSQDPDMSSGNNYRCGIFLMPAFTDPGAPPQKVFTLPTKLKAVCSMPKPAQYNQTCYELMRLSFSMWNYRQASKTSPNSDKTIGDDFCTLVGQDDDVGREVGFFFNYCGRGDWIDTSLRRKTRVCCHGGKYVTCRS